MLCLYCKTTEILNSIYSNICKTSFSTKPLPSSSFFSLYSLTKRRWLVSIHLFKSRIFLFSDKIRSTVWMFPMNCRVSTAVTAASKRIITDALFSYGSLIHINYTNRLLFLKPEEYMKVRINLSALSIYHFYIKYCESK